MAVSLAVKPRLVGRLVELRPVTVADAPGLVELLHDPEVRRLTGTPGRPRPGALQRAEEWYGSSAAAGDRLDLAIVEREGGTYVGEVALSDLDVPNRSCSFRIALVGPRAFGRGYGSEATRLVLGHAVDGRAAPRRTGGVRDEPAGAARLRARRLPPRGNPARRPAPGRRLDRRAPVRDPRPGPAGAVASAGGRPRYGSTAGPIVAA